MTGSDNNTGLDATINTATTRSEPNVQNPDNQRSVTAMTSDGSTVVFETDEALSVDDVDGGPDVYVWHDDGRVASISDGVGAGGLPWITPSGRDIGLFTAARLAALDGNVNGDIYDARVGGGFDLTQPVPCSGESCRARPGLVSGLPDGPAGVSGLGSVGSAHKSITTPGTVRMTLTLAKKARDRLVKRGKLSVRLVAGHSKVALDRSVTLRLTHTKPKSRAGVKRGSAITQVGASGGRRS